ncbi:MAG: hypothetical protein M1837_005167 [Sclerophora amabilis]|nr:MAG: hypothetical protein M1837_005167 [Sclerophora amabilis]
MENLNSSEQRELQGRMEKKQMKEFMTVSRTISLPAEGKGPPFAPLRVVEALLTLCPLQMYGKLVQKCFDDCVTDFTTKSLHTKEEGCVMRCVDKYLKGSERLGTRFQELNATMMQSGQIPGR